MLKIKECLREYNRDSYLCETSLPLNLSMSVINCEVGYSPFGCSVKMLEHIKDFDFSQVARYPEMFYARMLKPLIMNRFSNANLDSANIFFGHGSFNLAERVIHKFVVPRSMLGYGPQFNEIPTEMEAAGGNYRSIPMVNDFQFPLQDILCQIRKDEDSMLYIDNPNNPTGYLIPLENVEQMVREAEINGIIVIIDEAYGDFVSDDFSAINLVRKYSNLIVIRSFSKTLGLAAQRIGYMAISDSLVQDYLKVDVPFEPALVGAVMARSVLEDRDFLGDVINRSGSCKRRILTALINKGIQILPTHPDVSICMIHKTGVNLFAHFQKMGIKVENGSCYKRTNNLMDHSFLRLRVPNESETEEVVRRVECCDFEG